VTFADQISARLADDPGRPLVTFYDHTSGERVELSVATYANWVAKAASLLVDELDLERGSTLRVDLPPHWLGAVFLGAAWTAGLVVTDDDAPDAVVCGPDSLDRWATATGDTVVLACALLPLGVRFAEPVPAGVHDVGVEIWSQPDAFTPWDPPGDDDPAIVGTDDPREVRQGSLGELRPAVGGDLVLGHGGRLLTTANPADEPAVLTQPLYRAGSLVLVALDGDDQGQAGRERLEATYAAERATARFPA
jgi:uncharacterized protein (TIGR03089 family)